MEKVEGLARERAACNVVDAVIGGKEASLQHARRNCGLAFRGEVQAAQSGNADSIGHVVQVDVVRRRDRRKATVSRQPFLPPALSGYSPNLGAACPVGTKVDRGIIRRPVGNYTSTGVSSNCNGGSTLGRNDINPRRTLRPRVKGNTAAIV